VRAALRFGDVRVRVITVSRRSLLSLFLAACCAATVLADPLSKKVDVDFFRDAPSRNLKGLATRSDGRLVAGPRFAEFTAPSPADILWCIEPTNDPSRFLVGTGSDGRIVEITFNPNNATYGAKDVVKLDDPQVFALKRLPDGTIVAGTSPQGALYAVRDGKVIAKVLLPVDSIFDLLAIDNHTVLAATGNPGRIYRVDVRKFATVGVVADKITDAKILADRGISVFGEIRDRNVRRLAACRDGHIVAGSSPKGNIYSFPAAGGAPIILQENHDAEVTDLLPQNNGDLYAAVVFSGSTGESRVSGSRAPANASAKDHDHDSDSGARPTSPIEKFTGRTALVWFPAQGFPETLVTRTGVAVYRLFRHGDTLLMAGGDAGDLVGYDLSQKLSLTFPGSISAQLSGVIPVDRTGDKFLLLRNNAPGLALLDFSAAGPREAETRRLDLSTPAELGAVRFNRLRNIDPAAVTVEVRVNNGLDEVEGWGPWTKMKLDDDGGWRAPNLRGRSAKLRITLRSAAKTNAVATRDADLPQLDRAALYILPQNRRPILQDFRVLTPGYGIVPALEPAVSPVVTVNQLLQPRDDDKRKSGFSSSQIVPQPGTQLVLWTVNDPDGDAFTCTFSLRREGDATWTDVVTQTHDPFAQFDTGHMPEGIYFTRLVATETEPRPADQRLTQTFETDDLMIDHTPPELVEATAKRSGNAVVVTVHGRDRLSLLDSIDVTFSNGVHETVEQPVDGVRDGREETFALDLPLAQVSNATSVEVILYDAAGNSSARRLTWDNAKPAK